MGYGSAGAGSVARGSVLSLELALVLVLVLGPGSAALGPWFVPLSLVLVLGPVALALVLGPGSAALAALVLLYVFLWPHVFYMLLLSMLKIYMLYIHRVVGPPFHLELGRVSSRPDAYLCAFYLSDVYYMCFLRWFQTDILGI